MLLDFFGILGINFGVIFAKYAKPSKIAPKPETQDGRPSGPKTGEEEPGPRLETQAGGDWRPTQSVQDWRLEMEEPGEWLSRSAMENQEKP